MASLFLVSVPLPVNAAPTCGSTITASVTLTANILCSVDTPGLIIGASGVTLDCAGHVITGPAGSTQAGIHVVGVDSVTVVNCTVETFLVGIGLASSNGDTIKNNFALDNAVGIALQGSNGNTVVSNDVSSNSNDGFLIHCGISGCLTEPAANNHIKKNTADANGVGKFGGFGYHDITFGKGTSGTANHYAKNECSLNVSGGSSPTGLCKPQP